MCKYNEDSFMENKTEEVKLFYIMSKYSNTLIKSNEEQLITTILTDFLEEIRKQMDAHKIYIVENTNKIKTFITTPAKIHKYTSHKKIKDILKANENKLLKDSYIVDYNLEKNYNYFMGPLFIKSSIWGVLFVESKHQFLDFECSYLATLTNIINSSIEKLLYEKQIKEKEHFIKTICDNIPDYVWSKNSKGQYLFTNKSFRDFLDAKDEKEPIGKVYEYFYNRKKQKYEKQDFDPDKHGIIDKQVLEFNESIKYQDMGFDKNEPLVLDIFKTPFVFDDDKGVIAHAKDITKHVSLQRLLYERDTLLKIITDQIPSILFVRDLDGNIIYANKKFIHTFFSNTNKRFKDIIGKSLVELFPDNKEMIDDFKNIDKNIFLLKKELESVFCFQKAKNKKLWFGCLNIPLKTNNDMIGVITIGRDITEKVEEMEKFKEKYEKLTSTFLLYHSKEKEQIMEEIKQIRKNVEKFDFPT